MRFDKPSGNDSNATKHGRNYPVIHQFTVFLENRVGQLLEVLRRFEGTKVRVIALSVANLTECSLVRFLLSHPEEGREILERAGLPIVESDLIAIDLQGPQALSQICVALLQAEVTIVQAYPLFVRPRGRAALALKVDNFDITQEILAANGFNMLTETDLLDEQSTI